jgi:iron complex outermembrane recepter protein
MNVRGALHASRCGHSGLFALDFPGEEGFDAGDVARSFRIAVKHDRVTKVTSDGFCDGSDFCINAFRTLVTSANTKYSRSIKTMNKKPTFGVCSLALLLVSRLAAQTASVATSQSADQAAEKKEIVELSPFVVSSESDEGYHSQQTMVGSRSAKDLIDLPASVSIINQEQLSDFGAINVHDALRYSTSGVTQNQAFNDDVNIRGFRAGSPLRNGVERTVGSKGTPLYDIERVEVLKGPAAMLNGSNGGIGGSINYVSRKPTATPQGETEMSVTDQGAVRFQANVSGPLKKSDDFSVNYRFTLGALNSDAPHKKSIEWEDQQFYGAGLAMYFGNNSSLTINGYYFINRDYIYLEDFLDITAPLSPRTNLMDARLNQYSTQEYSPGRQEDAFWPVKTTAIDITYLTKLTENGNLRAVYYYGRVDDRRENNRGITLRPDNYTLARQDIRNNNGNETHNFQLDYLHHLSLKWVTVDSTLGGDGSIAKTWEDQSITFMPDADTRTGVPPNDAAWFAMFPNDAAYFITPRPASVGTPATRTRSKPRSFSYYFQENLSFWKDRIILVGGLRWFKPSGTNENVVTNTITNRPDQSFKVHKYGIVYKVLPSVSLYYTDAQNVFPAAPGFTDKVIQGDGLGEAYKDSLGKLREAGVKVDYKLSNKISMYGSAAAFEMEQTNIRTFGTLPSGSQGLIQSAKDSATGWEADYGVQLKTAGGRADVILTYFHGNSAIADDAGKAYVRQANAFVPQKFSFFGKYSWTTGGLKGLRLGGGFEIEHDKRYGGFMLDHPLVADAFAAYTIGRHWDIQLNLNNLTNERYIIQVAANGLVQTSDTFRSKLTVRYNW